VQLARNDGAFVVGVSSSRNVALVEAWGAKSIDHTRGSALEEAQALGPYELIIDAVGSAAYPRGRCVALLAPKGVLVKVVPIASDLPFIALPGPTHTVLGRATRARLEPLVAAIAEGKLEVRLHERIPLREAERAQQVSRSGKVVGKLVLVR